MTEEFDISQFLRKEPKHHYTRKKHVPKGDMPSLNVRVPSLDYAKELTQKMIEGKNYEAWKERVLSLVKEFAPNFTEGCFYITFHSGCIMLDLHILKHALLNHTLFYDKKRQIWYEAGTRKEEENEEGKKEEHKEGKEEEHKEEKEEEHVKSETNDTGLV